jgi:hypothetical protein
MYACGDVYVCVCTVNITLTFITSLIECLVQPATNTHIIWTTCRLLEPVVVNLKFAPCKHDCCVMMSAWMIVFLILDSSDISAVSEH